MAPTVIDAGVAAAVWVDAAPLPGAAVEAVLVEEEAAALWAPPPALATAASTSALVMPITSPFGPWAKAVTGRVALAVPVERTALPPLTDSIVPTAPPLASATCAPTVTLGAGADAAAVAGAALSGTVLVAAGGWLAGALVCASDGAAIRALLANAKAIYFMILSDTGYMFEKEYRNPSPCTSNSPDETLDFQDENDQD